MSKIKLLVMDVDGTLTDGKIYMGQEGESFKTFDIKDGAGIALLLPKYGIVPVVITARKSQILENRCKELKIEELHQDCFYKLEKLKEIVTRYGVSMDSVAYVGDDIPDIPCMEEVKKHGGVVLCPSDAIIEIKALSNYVSDLKAGNGAIRDCINYLAIRNKNHIESRIQRVIDAIISKQYSEGTIEGNQYTIQEYETKEEKNCVLETHRCHIDVQYIIAGHEEFLTYQPHGLTSMAKYNSNNDVEYWRDGFVSSRSILVPGSLIVIMNNQPHKGAIIHKKTEIVKKIVCKISL